jgi:hypothetical protein
MDAEFLADFNLDWQTVSIPARLAIAQVASHGAVAWKKIFDGAREAMTRVGQAVGRWWAFKENKRLRPVP